MYNDDGYFRVADGDGWRAIALPYQVDRFAMVVIVPEDFATYEASLDADTLNGVAGTLAIADWQSVRLTLPKFETDTKLRIGGDVTSIGDVFGI